MNTLGLRDHEIMSREVNWKMLTVLNTVCLYHFNCYLYSFFFIYFY